MSSTSASATAVAAAAVGDGRRRRGVHPQLALHLGLELLHLPHRLEHVLPDLLEPGARLVELRLLLDLLEQLGELEQHDERVRQPGVRESPALAFGVRVSGVSPAHAQLLRHLVVALDGVEAALALPAADVGAGLDDVVVGDHGQSGCPGAIAALRRSATTAIDKHPAFVLRRRENRSHDASVKIRRRRVVLASAISGRGRTAELQELRRRRAALRRHRISRDHIFEEDTALCGDTSSSAPEKERRQLGAIRPSSTSRHDPRQGEGDDPRFHFAEASLGCLGGKGQRVTIGEVTVDTSGGDASAPVARDVSSKQSSRLTLAEEATRRRAPAEVAKVAATMG